MLKNSCPKFNAAPPESSFDIHSAALLHSDIYPTVVCQIAVGQNDCLVVGSQKLGIENLSRLRSVKPEAFADCRAVPGRFVGYLSSSHMAAVLLAGSAGTVSLPLSTSS